MADWTEVDTVVAANNGLPLPSNASQPVTIVSEPLPFPFSQPTYRTKDNATSDWITCAAGATTNVDYQITHEIWTHGGEAIIYNAQEGDWISACVVDNDSVIQTSTR